MTAAGYVRTSRLLPDRGTNRPVTYAGAAYRGNGQLIGFTDNQPTRSKARARALRLLKNGATP